VSLILEVRRRHHDQDSGFVEGCELGPSCQTFFYSEGASAGVLLVGLAAGKHVVTEAGSVSVC